MGLVNITLGEIMFDKKFRKRVCFFGQDYYIVQFAWYRIIPIWHTLNFWFEQSLIGGTECWSTKLYKYNDAINTAKSLHSIEDINNYYVPYKNMEKMFYNAKKEYYAKNVPVKKQEII